jgi:hypothetical protein
MNLGEIVHKVVATAESDAAKVKSAIIKAMTEIDTVVLPEATKLEPLVQQVADAVAPGGGAIVNVAYAWLESTAKVIDAGGAAAEQNLSDAGLDVATIQAIKGLIPQLKAAATAK